MHVKLFSRNLKYLRVSRNCSQSHLATHLGVRPGTVSNYENRVSEPSLTLLLKISQFFEVNVHDLISTDLTESGTHFHKQTNGRGNPPAGLSRLPMEFMLRPVPLISWDSWTSAWNNISSGNTNGHAMAWYTIPDLQSANFLIRVHGNDMEPRFGNGDLAVCRVVPSFTSLQWGKPHFLDTMTHGPLLRRLYPTEGDESVKAVSDNPEFPPFVIERGDIIAMAMVIGSLRHD